jgi:hypothetical protein
MLVCYFFFKLCRCIIANKFRAGVELAKYPPGPHDTSDSLSLEASTPRMAGVKIEEKLEQLLTPTSRSISFKLTLVSAVNARNLQKPFVQKTLITFVSVFHIFFTQVINLQPLGTSFGPIPLKMKGIKKNIESRYLKRSLLIGSLNIVHQWLSATPQRKLSRKVFS